MSPAQPFVIAHRGASHDANENTASSLALAREQGAPWIEIDVRRSRDGAIVVFHDEDLARACGGDARRVADLSLAELRALAVRFDPRFHPEPIVTLDEALAFASPLPLAIEVKGPDPDLRGFVREIAAVLARRGDSTSVVISFEDAAAAEAVESIAAARAGLIRNTEYGEEGWRDLLRAPCGIAVFSRRIATPERVAALSEAGKRPWCYALDDAEAVRAHVAMGVEGVISNRPAVALAALRAT